MSICYGKATVTAYYFGLSNELLVKYAWYQANSIEHAWSCGSLLPNEFGLFDMLGNEFEWVQDRVDRAKSEKAGAFIDIINIYESVVDKSPRLLRGGTFGYRPAGVRSAIRDGVAPSYRDANFGFRPARTYH